MKVGVKVYNYPFRVGLSTYRYGIIFRFFCRWRVWGKQ